MMEVRRNYLLSIGLAMTAGYLVMRAGGRLTDAGSWYRSLAKPEWQPPDKLFGPVWLGIVAMAAVAASIAWWRAADDRGRALIVLLFGYNAALATGWSFLFFRLQRPDWALADVAFLWLSIAALIVVLWPLSRPASLLLSPYLAWVCFAALLNRAIVELNGPFGGTA